MEGIECAFERLDGYLFNLPGNKPKDLADEYGAASRAGVPVELWDRIPGLQFDSGPCLRYSSLAQFHPVKYLAGLADCLDARGVKIYTGTPASQIETRDGRQVVTTPLGRIAANVAVVATNTPFNNRVAMHTKQADTGAMSSLRGYRKEVYRASSGGIRAIHTITFACIAHGICRIVTF